jgi:hypothetical protein
MNTLQKNFIKGDGNVGELTITEIEHRLVAAEENIKELFGKVNGVDKTLVATTTTLNNLLSAVGELKGAIEALKSRPTMWWDKLVFAVIGATISAIITYFIK